MSYDSAGNILHEPFFQCDCGSTGGCEKCRPTQTLEVSTTVPCQNEEELEEEIRKIIAKANYGNAI